MKELQLANSDMFIVIDCEHICDANWRSETMLQMEVYRIFVVNITPAMLHTELSTKVRCLYRWPEIMSQVKLWRFKVNPLILNARFSHAVKSAVHAPRIS